MEMICVKKLPIIGSTNSNLTIGKKYSVIFIPIPLLKGRKVEKPTMPKVFVKDDLNSEYQYPLEAFVSIEEWRDIQLDKLLNT